MLGSDCASMREKMGSDGGGHGLRPGTSPTPAKGNLRGSVSAPSLLNTAELSCDDDGLEMMFDRFVRGGGWQPSASARANSSRPATVSGWGSSASSDGRPASAWSLAQSSTCFEAPRTHNKAPSGRFADEEARCFMRKPHYQPSAQCQQKANIYFQTVGDTKKRLALDNWNSLPVLKGKFYSNAPLLVDDGRATSFDFERKRRCNLQVHSDILPDEMLTAKVLNEIFPRTPRKDFVAHAEETSPNSSVSPERTGAISPADVAKAKYMAEELAKKGKCLRFGKNTLPGGGLDSSMGTPSSSAPAEPKTPSRSEASKCSSPTGGQSVTKSDARKEGLCSDSPSNVKLTPLVAMMDFRRLLLERYHNMDEAVKYIISENHDPSVMTKKDFRCALQKHSLELTKDERDAVFEHLDLDGDGKVTMIELEIAIHAASPVKSLVDLRRRWLAAGLPSLDQVVRILQDAGAQVAARLSLREFGEMLSHLHVTEHEEHLLLFNIIVDPNDRHSRVAMTELIAALATLSPATLLEDIHHNLDRRYRGNFDRAFTDIDVDRQGFVKMQDFVDRTVGVINLSEHEAMKVFRAIDVDESGRFTKAEFLSAIALSEPSLFLEDLRRKVLQRFRSIQATFQKALNADERLRAVPLPLEKYQEILLPVEFSEEEIAKIFSLIDIQESGALKVVEFVKGTLQFAPSWALEDLRILTGLIHKQPSESFLDVEISRTKPLDLQSFSELLADLKLDVGVKVPAIFDIVDVMHEGHITLGKLIAALQAGGAGSSVRLSGEECDTWAAQDVGRELGSIHKLIGELKLQVRHKGENDLQDGDAVVASRPPEPPPLTKVGALRKNLQKKVSTLFGIGKTQTAAAATPATPATPQGNQTEGADADKQASTPSSPTKPKEQVAKTKQVHVPVFKKRYMVAGHRSPYKMTAEEREAALAEAERKAKEMAGKAKHAPRLRPKTQADIRFYLDHQATATAAGPPKPVLNAREARDEETPWDCMMKDNQRSWDNVWGRMNDASGAKHRQNHVNNVQNYYQSATECLSHDVPLFEKAHSRHAVYSGLRKHVSALETEKQKIVYRFAADMDMRDVDA